MKKVIIVLGGNEEETQKRFKDGLSLYYQDRDSEIITSGIKIFEKIENYIKDICKKYKLNPKIIPEYKSTSTRENIENSLKLIDEDNEKISIVGGSRQMAEAKLYLRQKLKGHKLEFYGTSEMWNRYMPIHMVEIVTSFSLALMPGYTGEIITQYLKGIISSAKKTSI